MANYTSLKGKNSTRFKTKTKSSHRDTSSFRLLIVWVVLTSSILGLLWRLFFLQIIQGQELTQKAKQQQLVKINPFVPRRSIVDVEGNTLASDRLMYTLYVHPQSFKKGQNSREIAQKLSDVIVTMKPEKLLAIFPTKKSGIRVVDNLTESQAIKIKALGLDGIDVEQEYSRFYPQKESVADLLGFVNMDRKGQAGIEYSWEDLLERSGTNYYAKITRHGDVMPAEIPHGLMNFDDLKLQLTIDLRLQEAARIALRNTIRQYKAKRGAIVVMDAYDGSILTLVCEPTYDPNEYYNFPPALFKNWTVSDLYEPGSTFKPINLAIALDAGVIKFDSHIYDSGSIQVDVWQINNASKSGYGNISISEVLQNSSNVGMVQIMSRMHKQDYYQQLRKLGLGEKTGLDLPGDAASYLKPKNLFMRGNIEAATAAFGQGLSLTPLKLVQLNAAIANGGKLVTPHVVKGLVDPEGELHWEPSLSTTPVFTADSAHHVLKMMEAVVTKGSGKAAIIPGYRIAGKTGTAQKASSRGGYLKGAKITSFVAILPAEAPRYIVLSIVDEPQGANTFGGTVAAPMAKNIMESIIALKGIPPSNPEALLKQENKKNKKP